MAAVRYLYLLHVRDVRCGHCGDTVLHATSAQPQLRVAVGAHERPIRLPALEALPAPVLMSVRCAACGRDAFYAVPSDAVPLLSEHAPEARTASARYVLAGA